MQELFTQTVNHTYKQSRSKEFKTRSGFYTDQMMKDELKFSKLLCRNYSCSMEEWVVHVKVCVCVCANVYIHICMGMGLHDNTFTCIECTYVCAHI